MSALDGNALAFDPVRAARRGHVESYFLKLNSPDGARALWLKWTLFAAPGARPRAESWAIAFARDLPPRAFKRSWDLDPSAMLRTPFALEFPATRFDGLRTDGELSAGEARLGWDLSLSPRVPSLRPFPFAWMYRARLPETKLTTPVPDAIAHGRYVLDGERVDVSGWRAMQGHNWGTRHAHRYAWCHAAGFDGADEVVFEGLSGRLHRAGRELPWLTLAFLWTGERWLRFDAPRSLARAPVEAGVMHWRFETRAGEHRLRGEASARPLETAGLHYPNPIGPLTYCLNSKLARLALTLTGPSGTRHFETDRAALEVGLPCADHGITMVA
jgi:hypothetical protein